MKLTALLLLFLSFLVASTAYAIDPFYEGANGIREKVFATNCLDCHSSTLTGTKRNGAPSKTNWDTYEDTFPNASRAINRAVVNGTMPPASSSLPLLNDEQKAAMLAWQNAGFPKAAQLTGAATFDIDSLVLNLPVVNLGNATKISATLTLTPLSTSPTGFGFILGPVNPSTETSDSPATFDAGNGQLQLPVVHLIKNGVVQGQISAEMVYVPGSSPALLSLTSVK